MAARWRRATIALRAWSLRRLSGSSSWSFCLLAAALPAKLVSDGAWAWVHFVLAVLVLAPLALLSITHSTLRGEWPLAEVGLWACICLPLVDVGLALHAGSTLAAAAHLWNAAVLLLLASGYASARLEAWHCLRGYLLLSGCGAIGATLHAYRTGASRFPAPGGVASEGITTLCMAAAELVLAAALRPSVRQRLIELWLTVPLSSLPSDGEGLHGVAPPSPTPGGKGEDARSIESFCTESHASTFLDGEDRANLPMNTAEHFALTRIFRTTHHQHAPLQTAPVLLGVAA